MPDPRVFSCWLSHHDDSLAKFHTHLIGGRQLGRETRAKTLGSESSSRSYRPRRLRWSAYVPIALWALPARERGAATKYMGGCRHRRLRRVADELLRSDIANVRTSEKIRPRFRDQPPPQTRSSVPPSPNRVPVSSAGRTVASPDPICSIRITSGRSGRRCRIGAEFPGRNLRPESFVPAGGGDCRKQTGEIVSADLYGCRTPAPFCQVGRGWVRAELSPRCRTPGLRTRCGSPTSNRPKLVLDS